MVEKRNFALRDKDGIEIGVFSGKQPRQAALKAANRGFTDIRLRERGTKKVHIYQGERTQVPKPPMHPHGCRSISGSRMSRRWASKNWKSFSITSLKARPRGRILGAQGPKKALISLLFA